MGSYYHDHPSYNEPSSAPSYSQNDQHTSPPPPDNTQIGGGILRGCSVRGCNAILPPDYALKMCEHCRERHRVYANTKRLKRKMEKMAIGQQAGLLSNVVWMDNEEQDETAQSQQPGPSHQSQVTQSPEPAPPPPQPQYGFSPTSWDNSAIDPRLFTHNSSSELAGALTLPTPQHLHPHAQRHAQPPAPPMAALLPPEGHEYPPVASTSRAPAPPPPPPVPSNENPHHLPTYPPINSLPPPRTEISAKAISEAAEQMGDTALPHRYCSIKGCKAVVPGNSFFKMCEPCRNRYRSYGTTKRAKWRREKEAAVAELQKLRVEEDKRRAENGLPPLTDTEAQWSGYQAPPSPSSSSQQPPLPPSPTLPTTRSPYAQVSPSLAPRMCTVSHCREILPGEYEFLRCERHRIQNRHHSKLKRVRDKESKAVAFDDWAAAVTAQAHKEEEEESGGEEEEEEEEEAMSGDNAEHTDHFVGPQVIPPSEPNLGLPPAARGTRRTNHVCSIKVCYNLLSPNNPWKMCDTCRARDRTARRIKALRDSGIDVPPLPPRVKSPKPEGEQGKKGKKKKGKKKAISAEEVVNDVEGRGENATTGSGSSGSSNNPTPNANASGSGIGESSSITQTGAPPMLVFMDPILSDDPSPFVDPLSNTAKATTNNASNGRHGELSFILADENGNIREPPEVVGSTTSEKESAPPPAASTSTSALAIASESAPTPAPTRKKRSSKKKDKAAKSNGGNASAPTASTSSSNGGNASTSTAPAATSAASAPSTSTQPASASTAPSAPDTSSIYIQPSYNVPYYMPPPFAIPPYAPGTRYPPYGGYSRDPYAPSTMYQPPPYPYAYPPYPPPPPPPGYGQYPPPQMHTFPPVPPPPGITPGLVASGPTAPAPPPASSSPAGAVTTPRQTHPQTQTQVPPPPPPDASSMYSTFSSRPSGSTVPTTGTHTNITPYGSSSSSSITTSTKTATTSNNNNNNNASTSTSTQPTQPPVEASSQSYNYNYTFSAKTGETYSRGGGSGMGTGTGQKRKKAVMDSEALEKYKRTHIDKVGAGGSGSKESSGSGVVGAGAGVGAGVSVGSVSRSEGIGAGAVAQSQTGTSSASEGNGNGVMNGLSPLVATAAVTATGLTNGEVEATQRPSENSGKRNWCANKACHRTLPVDYSGTLCEKCKERIKKRQQQAKQRFKLEPRKSLATGTSNGGVGRHDTPSVHQCG